MPIIENQIPLFSDTEKVVAILVFSRSGLFKILINLFQTFCILIECKIFRNIFCKDFKLCIGPVDKADMLKLFFK